MVILLYQGNFKILIIGWRGRNIMQKFLSLLFPGAGSCEAFWFWRAAGLVLSGAGMHLIPTTRAQPL